MLASEDVFIGNNTSSASEIPIFVSAAFAFGTRVEATSSDVPQGNRSYTYTLFLNDVEVATLEIHRNEQFDVVDVAIQLKKGDKLTCKVLTDAGSNAAFHEVILFGVAL